MLKQVYLDEVFGQKNEAIYKSKPLKVVEMKVCVTVHTLIE